MATEERTPLRSPPARGAEIDTSSSPGRGGHRLTLLVQEVDPGVYRFLLDAADRANGPNNEAYGPFRLHRDPREFLGTFFDSLAELASSTVAPEVAQRQLESRATELFRQLFPPELRRRLWSLRHGTQTLQVQSEEPWIPWELCKLEGEDGSRRLPGPFLCEAFAVTRFLPHYSQPTRLPLARIAVVATGGLPHANDELTEIRALAAGRHDVKPVPADYLKIVDALAAGRYDGWHFIGHGRFDSADPNRSAIVLDDVQELTPEDLNSAGDFGGRQPFVFWNACSTGRADLTLAGIGGWPKAFLAAGAGAFLGSFWQIPDDPARRFALAFYRRFFAGDPLAEAIRGARLEIRKPGDPTWLAYTVYANPAARCLAAGEGDEAPPSSASVPVQVLSPVTPPANHSAEESRGSNIVPTPRQPLSPRALVGWAAAAWAHFFAGGCGLGVVTGSIAQILQSGLHPTFTFYLLFLAIPASFRAASVCDQRLRAHLSQSQRYAAVLLSCATGLFLGISPFMG